MPVVSIVLDSAWWIFNKFVLEEKETTPEEALKTRENLTPEDFNLWFLPASGVDLPHTIKSRAKIVSVANFKGGVGKSTITANLGATLSDFGYRVLLVDLDWQESLSRLCLTVDQVADFRHSNDIPIRDALLKYGRTDNWEPPIIQPIEVRRDGKQLHVAPTHYSLMGAEDFALVTYFLSATEERGPKPDVRFIVARMLQQWAENYDFVIVDTPPRLTVSMTGALAISDLVLVPVQPDEVAMNGAELFFSDPLDKFRQCLWSNGRSVPTFGVVANRVNSNRGARKTAVDHVSRLVGQINVDRGLSINCSSKPIIDYTAYRDAAQDTRSERRTFAVDKRSNSGPKARRQFDQVAEDLLQWMRMDSLPNNRVFNLRPKL